MNSAMISIAKQYSRTPAGRYRSDGPRSAEQFREEILAPALSRGQDVTVDLDGTLGYSFSFLEEAFGGLVRNGFQLADLKSRLHITTSLAVYEERVWRYMSEAARAEKSGCDSDLG
jgi:hypothetical protein